MSNKILHIESVAQCLSHTHKNNSVMETKPKRLVKVKVKSLGHVRLFATPWTVAHQAPPSMGFSRQEYWSGLPFPSPGDLPDPRMEPRSLALQADSLPAEPQGKPNTGLIKDTGLVPGSGRSPGGGHGNPLQYSCLETPTDREAWRAAVHGFAKSQP